MNKKTYNQQCQKLKELCEAKGIQLDFDPDRFDNNRLDCLWYGGHIACLTKKNIEVFIDVYGDVRATLYDENHTELSYVKDKNNAGRFYDEMSYYIKNDEELSTLLDSDKLVLDNNNWIEYNIRVEGCYINMDLCGNILESCNILEAIKEVIEIFEDIINVEVE